MNNSQEKLITYNYYYNNNYKYKSSTKKFSNKLDYQKTIALKKIIENEYNSKTKWFFKKDGVLNYTIIIKDSFDYLIMGKKYVINYITHVSFSEKLFSKICVTSYIFQNVTDDNLQDVIQQKNKEIKDNIKEIYNKVLEALIKENCYFEPVQLCYGSVSGFYDFGVIQIDAGEYQKIYNNPEIIKMKVNYNKIIVEGIKKNNTINDSIDIDRIIARNLIQLLLRFPIEEKVSDGKYYMRKDFMVNHNFILDEENKGKMYEIDRSSIIGNDYTGFPADSEKIVKKFYSLEFEKKNVFLQSCISYANGLKSKSVKAIAYFVLSIENIANYNSKSSHQICNKGNFNKKIVENEGKKSLIYKTINNIYGKEMVSEEYINIIYKIRSNHFHEGIENSDIFISGMGIDEGDKYLVDSAERLAHSFLIKWLLEV